MLRPTVLILAGLALGGCLSDSGDPTKPPPETGTEGLADAPPSYFRASWDPENGIGPYPNDIFGFLAFGSSDGSLNLPLTLTQPNAEFLNTLDGFSTNARIKVNFSDSVDDETVTPASILFLEVVLDPATKAVVGLPPESLQKILNGESPFLQQGVDYDTQVAPDINAGDQTVELTMLKPLNQESGYLVYALDSIESQDGTAAAADVSYAEIRDAYLAGLIELPGPGEELPPDLTAEEQIALYISTHLALAELLGVPVENIIVSASYSTLSTTSTMEAVNALTTSQPSAIQQVLTPVDLPTEGGVLPAGTPVTSGLILGLLGTDPSVIRDNADIYAGTLDIPYYLASPDTGDPLTDFWEAEAGGNPLDAESTNIIRLNPVPVQRETVTVPVLISLPNDNSAYAQALGGTATKPAEGWPVVLGYHGITRNRTDLLAAVEGYADAGLALISMDQPLHGIAVEEIDYSTITPEELGQILSETPEALFRIPGVDERTFDLDLLDNTTGEFVEGGDGEIDPSGAHYINIPSPLTSRDNLRQSAADLITLTRSAPDMDLDDEEGGDFDGSRIYFLGQSLGSINGITYLGVDDTAVAATTGVPGGVITQLLIDSDTFGPRINAGLIERGLLPGTSLYVDFLRDVQNIIDAGDPISYGAEAAALHPIHLIEVVDDAVIPNSATNRLVAVMELDDITTTTIDAAGVRGRVCFTSGGHGSQLDPTDDPAATVEMQTQSVVFAAGNPLAMLPADGQTILISNSSIIGTGEDCGDD